MQQALFLTPEPNKELSPKVLFTDLDRRRLAYAEARNDRWQCIKTILYEEYLWDMRCWHKPKWEYSKKEVYEHIQKWVKDHEQGNWTSNCGHCLYCIRKLLCLKWATPEEVATLILRNNKIKYHNDINTWGNGIDDDPEEDEQINSCSTLK